MTEERICDVGSQRTKIKNKGWRMTEELRKLWCWIIVTKLRRMGRGWVKIGIVMFDLSDRKWRRKARGWLKKGIVMLEHSGKKWRRKDTGLLKKGIVILDNSGQKWKWKGKRMTEKRNCDEPWRLKMNERRQGVRRLENYLPFSRNIMNDLRRWNVMNIG